MGRANPALNPRFLRERLAEHLRQERERARLSQSEAADGVAWSVSKLQRIETGVVGISATDTRALLQLYGTSEAETVDRLARLAGEARRRDRFTPFRKFMSSEYQALLSYEQSASEVFVVNAFLLPGLLQTPEYARALLSVKHTGDKLDALVEARTVRQRILDEPDGPRFVFVVDEGALHRHVGGSGVLHAQLTHLRRMMERPNLDLHIIPFTAAAHLGLWELYVIMTIPASTLTGEPDRTIVYREAGETEFLAHNDKTRVDEYRESFDKVLAESLDRTKTCDVLDRLIHELAGAEAASSPPPPTR
jgi:transcriptional regulator with XRE-family HTH domain